MSEPCDITECAHRLVLQEQMDWYADQSEMLAAQLQRVDNNAGRAERLLDGLDREETFEKAWDRIVLARRFLRERREK